MTTDQAERVIEAQAREFEDAEAVPGGSLEGARCARRAADAAASARAPYRILLPLANPRTARDLVRIGAGVAGSRPDRDHRARHRRGAGRRLPGRGRDDRPHRAAPPAAGPRLRRRGGGRDPDDGAHRPSRGRRRDRGGRRGGLRPRHLRLGRPALPGRSGAVARRRAGAPARRPSSPRRSTRWCASRRPTSPSSSSAASTRCSSILVPVRGGPHAELAMRTGARPRQAIRGAGGGDARRPEGDRGAGVPARAGGARRLRARPRWRHGRCAACCARRRRCERRSCARRAATSWW